MPYSIDRSLSWDGLYSFTSESGASYMVKMKETSPRSGLWTINFIKNSGESTPTEIFKTIKILSDLCKEYINSQNGNRALLLISGDEKESEQKAKVFSRWMGEEWDCLIHRPNVKISGLRKSSIPTTPFAIMATRRPKIEEVEKPKTIDSPVNFEIKFCYNCGSPNNNFVFCPSCGTKLKQA